MYRQPSIDGDNITISKRRKLVGVVLAEEENATHRPKFVTQNPLCNKRKPQVSIDPTIVDNNEHEEGLLN